MPTSRPRRSWMSLIAMLLAGLMAGFAMGYLSHIIVTRDGFVSASEPEELRDQLYTILALDHEGEDIESEASSTSLSEDELDAIDGRIRLLQRKAASLRKAIDASRVLEVTIKEIVKEPVRDEDRFLARLTVRDPELAFAEAPGIVRNCLVDEGSWVTAGQRLCRIDRSNQVGFQSTWAIAGIDGQVSRMLVEPGNFVQENMPILQIVDASHLVMEILVTLDQTDLLQALRAPDPPQLEVSWPSQASEEPAPEASKDESEEEASSESPVAPAEGDTNEPEEGEDSSDVEPPNTTELSEEATADEATAEEEDSIEVLSISPAASSETGVFRVVLGANQAVTEAWQNGSLFLDTYVTVTRVLRLKEAVLVPRRLVQWRPMVFVLEEGDVVAERMVVLGEQRGDQNEIASGLEAGDRLIISYNRRPAEGEVATIAEPPAEEDMRGARQGGPS